MRVRFVRCGILLPLSVLAQAAPARAQPANDPVAAESVFESAKDLLQAGDWPGACLKFQASMDLDPSVSTLLKIAKCREHEGKLATASYDYQRALKLNRATAASKQRKKELEEFAESALAAVLPRVPKLRILIANRPVGLKLVRNGQELPAAVLGEALPVDPGDQEILAEAPGYRAEKRTVTLKEGEHVDVELALSAGAAIASPPTAPALSDAPPSDGKVQRISGLVVGGLGVVSLGIAAVFGLRTLSKVSDSSTLCTANNQCTQPGLDLRSDAAQSQTLGFVFLGIGGAAVVTGITLYATAPSSASARAGAESAPNVAIHVLPGGLAASGAW